MRIRLYQVDAFASRVFEGNPRPFSISNQTAMIVTSQDAQRMIFAGVDFLLLSHGKESMATKMLYKKGDNVPIHKHTSEQSGYVITGKYILILDDAKHEIGPGDSYTIPSNTEHAIEIIEPGEVLDFFSPPRKDYLVQHPDSGT